MMETNCNEGTMSEEKMGDKYYWLGNTVLFYNSEGGIEDLEAIHYALDFAGNFLDGGGFGSRIQQVGGSFRLNDGAYNGNFLSIRHYGSGWGNSKAGGAAYEHIKK